MSLKPWRRVRSSAGPDYRIFRVREDEAEHPTTKEVFPRVVLEAEDWINVLAITTAGEAVMVRQFRHGTERFTDEVVAGIADPGESALDAAKRELREETGYTSQRWSHLATTSTNPAFMNNACHMYLAEEAVRSEETELDPGEEIEVHLVPLDEARAMILAGEIDHPQAIACLAHYFLRPPRA